MTMDRRTQCGFIGLGDQGAPIARRMIDAGYPTILWARRPESLDPFRDTSAEFASSIAELGARAEHVGVCVLDDAGVLEVCGQLVASMRPGSRIAIHSTVNPETCKTVARWAAGRSVAVIDAPVSGGAPVAKAGGLTLMLGGKPEDLEAARRVFETFGKLIVNLGDIGAGQAAKLINNSLMAANLSTAVSALRAGSKLGIDPAALVQILLASSGRSFGVEVAARMTSPQAFAHGAMVLTKDLHLLGEVLGAADPEYRVLSNAASPFLDLARS